MLYYVSLYIRVVKFHSLVILGLSWSFVGLKRSRSIRTREHKIPRSKGVWRELLLVISKTVRFFVKLAGLREKVRMLSYLYQFLFQKWGLPVFGRKFFTTKKPKLRADNSSRGSGSEEMIKCNGLKSINFFNGSYQIFCGWFFNRYDHVIARGFQVTLDHVS